jgi:hypothetical protein
VCGNPSTQTHERNQQSHPAAVLQKFTSICYFNTAISRTYRQINIDAISWPLQSGRSGDPIPVGARLSAPIKTGTGNHPTSRTMGAGSLLQEQSGRGAVVDHPPPSSVEVKESVELYTYPPCWAFMACSMVNFTFYLYLYSIFIIVPLYY